jgi:hypothetical protein
MMLLKANSAEAAYSPRAPALSEKILGCKETKFGRSIKN